MASVALLLAASCGRGQEDGAAPAAQPTAAPTTAVPSMPTLPPGQTFKIQVDGRADGVNAALAAFFPNNVTARGGDTLEFSLPHSNGEPHTVTLGTLVEEGLFRADAAAKLPSLLPRQRPSGPMEANQAADQPCFLEAGDPPASPTGGAPACPKLSQPEFTGTQRFFNSGLLSEGNRFRLTLGKDIRPGSYQFMCLVHGGRMTGVVKIAGAGDPLPSPAEVEAAGRRDSVARPPWSRARQPGPPAPPPSGPWPGRA